MSEHATRDELIALRLGRMSGDDSRELLNHVAACAACQRAAQETLALDADARELVRAVARSDAPLRRARSLRWLAAAAVLCAFAAGLAFWLRPGRTTPPVAHVPPPPRTETTATTVPPAVEARPSPWDAIVRDAVRAGALLPPATLTALQPGADRFRAREGDPAAADLQPSAEVVEDDRPEFRWPDKAGATFLVLVGYRGDIVARSASLTRNRWRCDVELVRGRTYTWQVEVRRGDTAIVLPVPPAPEARFHVLGAEWKAQLDAARAAAPEDHLLLGILAARAGLRSHAIVHLSKAADAGADGARELLASVRSWPSAPR